MADPLSIIASVVGTATAVVQSAKALFELVDDIKGGPQEIKSISQDARAFYAVVFSLNVALKEEKIKDVVGGDEDMVEMIRNLQSPLANCQMVLGELMVKMQKRMKPSPDGKGFQISVNNVKWALYTKSEVRDLQSRLEAAKSTLDGALGAVTTIRLMAMGKASVARQVKRSSAATDASFAIRRFVEESISECTNDTESSESESSEHVPASVFSDQGTSMAYRPPKLRDFETTSTPRLLNSRIFDPDPPKSVSNTMASLGGLEVQVRPQYSSQSSPLSTRNGQNVVPTRTAQNHLMTTGKSVPFALHQAVKGFDHTLALKLVFQDGVDVNVADLTGKTALSLAFEYENMEAALMLLKGGRDVNSKLLVERITNDATFKSVPQTPLMLAIRMEKAPFIEKLLDLGADPNLSPTGEESPLTRATSAELPDVMRILIKHGADVNHKCLGDETSLHHAAKSIIPTRGPEMIGILLEYGAYLEAKTSASDFTKFGIYQGATPLHYAARRGNSQCVRRLIQEGSNPEAIDMDGDQPIHVAALSGDTNILQILLDAGVDVDVPHGEYGDTPLMIAIRVQNLLVVKHLLKCGADVSTESKRGQICIGIAKITMEGARHSKKSREIFHAISKTN